MLIDNAKAIGSLVLELRGPDGELRQKKSVYNLIVNTGKAFMAQSLIKTTNSPAAMTHMGIGTGVTAAAAADSGLQSEIGSRQTVTATNVTTNVTNDTAQFVATFAAGNGTGAVTEAGIFNAASSGTMLCRTVFGVINKGVNDTLTVTWKVTMLGS
jgi:hypothetical protein